MSLKVLDKGGAANIRKVAMNTPVLDRYGLGHQLLLDGDERFKHFLSMGQCSINEKYLEKKKKL